MDLRSTVHTTFAADIFQRTKTFMSIFVGQPARPFCRLVIAFYGAVGKRRVFGIRSADLQILELEFLKKEMPYHMSCSNY
jgi:hypothetical protein